MACGGRPTALFSPRQSTPETAGCGCTMRRDRSVGERISTTLPVSIGGSIAEAVGTHHLAARASSVRMVWLPAHAYSAGTVEHLALRTAGPRDAMTLGSVKHMSRSALAAYHAATVAASHLPLRAGSWGSYGIFAGRYPFRLRVALTVAHTQYLARWAFRGGICLSSSENHAG